MPTAVLDTVALGRLRGISGGHIQVGGQAHELLVRLDWDGIAQKGRQAGGELHGRQLQGRDLSQLEKCQQKLRIVRSAGPDQHNTKGVLRPALYHITKYIVYMYCVNIHR